MDKVREAALKYAVYNACQFGGKAQPGPVMGRIFAEFPEAKANAREVTGLINEVVSEVNSWSHERQLETVKQWPELFEQKKEAVEMKHLPPLRNVDAFPMVKVRFAPNPDGPLHLGSAESIIFSDEYAKMYRGHFILRFEDTSAEVKPPIPEMYDWIDEDLKWLGVRIDERYIQSDRLQIYYKYAEKLLGTGAAYVCTCDPDAYRKLYMTKKACRCRDLPSEEHIVRWRRMLDGTYRKGAAVVRIKTDIEHPNPAIRDWPALRISTRAHPRVGKKYRVWPLYNFSCAVDDHEMGVSHAIRGKEHEVNSTRQKYIFDHLGWRFPEVINVGRLGLEVGILSKSKIRVGVENGTYSGWDDPRLGTLRALRRRGLQPETIREIMIQVGPKPINVTLSWGNIAAANKKIIEPRANRYFFVQDPVEIVVEGASGELSARLPLHPDHLERGYREYTVKPVDGKLRLFAPLKDMKQAQGRLVRLMGLANVKVLRVGALVEAKYHSKQHQIAREERAPFIHWVTEGGSIATDVVMPDASRAVGLAERFCSSLKIDDIIQFERFGFVRVDSIDPFVAYYAHN